MIGLVKYGTGPHETELREIPVPETGDDDILLEVKAAGICGADIAWDDGLMPEKLNCPVVLGHEFAGQIAEVGKNITRWKVGDRVVSDGAADVCGVCDNCANSQFHICAKRISMGYNVDGGFARYVKIHARALARIPNTLMLLPDTVSFEEAAILEPTANAYKALCDDSKVKPGEDVVIFGAGPQGILSVIMAKLKGCGKIIAVGLEIDKARLEKAKEVGANYTLVADKQDVPAEVDRITKGKKVPLVVDCAGSNRVLPLAMKMVKPNGEIVKVGFDAQPYNGSLDLIVDHAITVQGHYGSEAHDWLNCINLLALGKLNLEPIISHRLTLENWKEGFRLIRGRQAIKIVFLL